MLKIINKTYPLLEKAPQHDSPEFIDYLRDNNVVVFENEAWIIIENCKYHTKTKPHLTAFYKYAEHSAIPALPIISYMFMDWEWRKKRASDQTVKRFHIHLIK